MLPGCSHCRLHMRLWLLQSVCGPCRMHRQEQQQRLGAGSKTFVSCNAALLSPGVSYVVDSGSMFASFSGHWRRAGCSQGFCSSPAEMASPHRGRCTTVVCVHPLCGLLSAGIALAASTQNSESMDTLVELASLNSAPKS